MKNDVYQIVTDQIIAKLEEGVCPWKKAWTTVDAGLPKNLVSKKPYRGINSFLLAVSDYSSPYWLTFKQAKKLGGSVRKGEKSTLIVFWKWIVKKNDDTGEEEKIPLLRYYRVFNVEQCDIPEGKVPEVEQPETFDFEQDDHCELVAEGYEDAPTVSHGSNQACYLPVEDHVRMPNRENFESSSMYYSVLFHELAHSTGHKSRLNREGVSKNAAAFGSETYSKEELVAEMGASFLCGVCGIVNETIDSNAAYLKSWIKVLKGDKKLIVTAAAQAQKAADHILGVTFESDDEE